MFTLFINNVMFISSGLPVKYIQLCEYIISVNSF